ncbi:MAG: hypothetical protein GY803_30155, partial [Chloroflexi bacterium]|nr:hypothetical protein [Chloroflexota bacterium]
MDNQGRSPYAWHFGADNPLPQRTRLYQNHSLNSVAWDQFQPRPDDIHIAAFLNIPVNETVWPDLVKKATFKTMKANAENIVAGGGSFLFGGVQRFLYKGTNGRWRGVLTLSELELYEAKAKKQL